MKKNATIEIRVSDSEIVVAPSLRAINRRADARRMSAEVTSELDKARCGDVTELIIDLGQVAWISSVGLNELIRLQTYSRSLGISFRLSSPSDAVRDVLRITRLERTFEFDDSSVESGPMLEDAEIETLNAPHLASTASP